MLLSDLLERDVVDASGERVGKVHEVHLADEDGLRLDGIVVGRGALLNRLGLHRHGTHGPPLLRWFVRALLPAPIVVLWSDVVDVGDAAAGAPIVVRVDQASASGAAGGSSGSSGGGAGAGAR